MQILPLKTQEVIQETSEKCTGKKSKSYIVSIPNEWWFTDYNFFSPLKIVTNLEKKTKSKTILFPSTGKWNINKGDYRVKLSNYNYGKDFLYYRDLKLKILKYSYLGAMLLVVGVVYFTSTILSKL